MEEMELADFGRVSPTSAPDTPLNAEELTFVIDSIQQELAKYRNKGAQIEQLKNLKSKLKFYFYEDPRVTEGVRSELETIVNHLPISFQLYLFLVTQTTEENKKMPFGLINSFIMKERFKNDPVSGANPERRPFETRLASYLESFTTNTKMERPWDGHAYEFPAFPDLGGTRRKRRRRRKTRKY